MTNYIKVKYKVIKVFSEGVFSKELNENSLQKQLNKLGEKGWDLTSNIEVNSNGTTKESLLVLKRYEDVPPLRSDTSA